MHVAFDLSQVLKPVAVAIGNFDGIHRGHQRVLEPILSAVAGIKTVLTFHPHPQAFFSGQPALYLTPFGEKVDLLQQLGLEQVVQLPFTQDFAAQTPPAFIETVLQEGLQVQQLSVGGDFCFGQRRSGNTATLVAWGQQRGVRVDVVPHMEWQDLKVSSSRIRAALATGDVETAAVLLGRPYKLEGVVIQGDQRGRLIGFPTANLSLPAEKVIPRDGVYSAWVWLEDHPSAQPAVMNIGIRPTVDGSRRTVEVHLLDWQGDLYGSLLKVDLHHFLRPEQKFASVQHLQEQILLDSQVARQLLGLIDVPQTAIQC